MNEIRLEDHLNYNPKFHINNRKSYRISELKLIADRSNSLADLAVILGRTAKAIATKRYLIKKENTLCPKVNTVHFNDKMRKLIDILLIIQRIILYDRPCANQMRNK